MTTLPSRWPWETPTPAVRTTEETVRLLQQDFVYAMRWTAVMVQSPHKALQICVNTRRGQIMPRGTAKFTDGTTLEFQDIGMPQVGAQEMTLAELGARVVEIINELGLEHVL